MEDLGVILLVSFGLMLLLLALGIYVGVIMAVLAVFVAHFFSGHADYLEAGIVVWPMMRSFVMVALPLFILMGEILVRSGVTNRLYWALDQWFHVLPGGLLHTNIASCAVFASVSGSSVATGATIGTVALPAFRQQRYNERLVLGSLAAGGTLGILIPPSMALIMYGLLTDTSIGQLFIGGIVPGICLAGLFMALIGGAAIARPRLPAARGRPCRCGRGSSPSSTFFRCCSSCSLCWGPFTWVSPRPRSRPRWGWSPRSSLRRATGASTE